MIIGDPFQLAVIAQRIDIWGEIVPGLTNGVLLLCVDGEYFPKSVFPATLSREVFLLKKHLENIPENEEVFCLPKERAVREMYRGVYTPPYEEERYDITPTSIADENYFIFAVRKGDEVRFLVARLSYNPAKSRREFKNLAVSEAIIPIEEVNQIASELGIYHSGLVEAQIDGNER